MKNTVRNLGGRGEDEGRREDQKEEGQGGPSSRPMGEGWSSLVQLCTS